jgi:hypothetical protein
LRWGRWQRRDVVETERHQGLEESQQLLGETVHTSVIVKKRGMPNVRVNVRLVVDSERFMQVLKGVRAGKDVESKFVDQRIV